MCEKSGNGSGFFYDLTGVKTVLYSAENKLNGGKCCLGLPKGGFIAIILSKEKRVL